MRATSALGRIEAHAGFLLDPEHVIQSRKWAGYRLNPYLLLVDLLQISPQSMR